MLRVFIVEDDEQMFQYLSQLLLSLAGVTVVGHEAREVPAVTWLVDNRQGWDLSIVDLMLAEGSGLRVLASSRVRAGHQRMVVLSSHVTRDAKRKSIDLGADAIFDKVTGVENLLSYCQTLSSQHASP